MDDLSGSLHRIGQDGGEPEVVLQTVQDEVHRGVEFGVGGGYVYVQTSDHRLVRAPLEGGSSETLVTDARLAGSSIVVDETHAYFTVPDVGVFRIAH